MRPDIYRVKSIGLGYLAIMAKPTTGDYIEDEFAVIAREEPKQLISLLVPQEDYAVRLMRRGFHQPMEWCFNRTQYQIAALAEK